MRVFIDFMTKEIRAADLQCATNLLERLSAAAHEHHAHEKKAMSLAVS
jgi:hypothetical protein